MRRNLFAPLPLLAMLLLLAVGLPVRAFCAADNPNIHVIESTPTSDFTDIDFNSDAVTHTKTGLIWKHCAEGLSGDGCGTGSATPMTWVNALKAANTANSAAFAGYRDWRLPNKKELESIVESCGYSPAINRFAFPAMPVLSAFWSGSSSATDPSWAWYVDFEDGITSEDDKLLSLFVRLVRGGQSVDTFDGFGTKPGLPAILYLLLD